MKNTKTNAAKLRNILAVALVAVIAFSFTALFLTGCNNGTTGSEKTLVSIAVTTLPTKTRYNIGDDLDTTDMVVTAAYSDGTTATVTDYTTSGYDFATDGQKTVTVTWQGKTAIFSVNVVDPNKPTAATPTASPASGAVVSGTTATLATATESAEIWYTVNGSIPAKGGTGSVQYTTPFAITPPVTIKAIAVKNGMNDSVMLEAAYTLPIQLTENIWADGSLPASSDVQLFTFTATASTQYIHFSFGTLTSLYVQVYDSSGAEVGNRASLNSSNKYVSRSVTEGQEYYIRVRPVYSDNSGTYWIGFTTSTTAPVIVSLPSNATRLTENIWTDGNLSTLSDVQWFKFTATSSMQFIHAGFGTLANLYVQVYDSNGAEVGSQTSLSGSATNTARTLTEGQEYYIRVWPYSSSYSGTYMIAFNLSTTAPVITLPSSATQLTLSTWADGNLPTSSDVQWFKFTATASTQYIHAGSGTLANLYVQVYDSNGVTVGSQASLSDGTTNISRIVTVGQEYYIRVRSVYYDNSGTYRIAFNASSTAPAITLPSNATQLTLNTWANGNIPTSGGEQWFKFTATASTQYIHAGFGTLTSLYVQVYDSSGAAVGSQTNLSGSTYISRTVTIEQVYYIRVRPYSSSYSGMYRIAFNASTAAPATVITLPSDATQLTLNTWADGNIPTSDGDQWFKFTATASTQYIHVSFGTLTDLYVQLYDASSVAVGGETNLWSSSTTYTSRTLTEDEEYYIRVRPFSSSDRGTYRIGFTASTTAPANVITLPSNATQLTLNTWADGNILTSGGDQWFKFTATASTQYIHVSFGTLNDLYVQLYDSSSVTVGSETNLWSSTTYTSRTLTEDEEYYIRVRPYNSSGRGTYRIGFNTGTILPGVIPLTGNTWADGNIPTSEGEQWFSFTATASTQYIHASFGTMTYLSVQLYNSYSSMVGDSTNLYGIATSISRTVTAGQMYYIRVRPIYSGGTYRIAFNASSTAPN